MSLSTITGRTGLGKGSLYHLFPGGKAEMAEAVLAITNDWFEANIFRQLETADDSSGAINRMFDAVDRHFCSGQQVCLVGSMALACSGDPFRAKLMEI